MKGTGKADETALPVPNPQRADSSFPTAGLAESWHVNAQAWTEVVRAGAIESRRLATDRAVIDTILERGPQRILDLGCGEGWLARALAKHGIEVVGVDASAPLIQAARLAGKGNFQVMSYAELVAAPQRAGCDFQVIVANFALLEEDVAALLQALRSLLAPAGILIIQTIHPWNAGAPYTDGWRIEDFHSFGSTNWQPMPWYFRTLGSWIQLLRDTGYKLEELREPIHPTSGLPLSLLLVMSVAQEQAI